MIKELLLAFAITTASGSGLLDVREPSRANDEEFNFTLYNGTPYELLFINGYSDEEFIVEPEMNTKINYTFHSSTDWAVYMKEDWDSITADLWYECLDSISQPSTPNWQYAQWEWESYFIVQGMTSNTHGLGVYEQRYLPRNTDFYIDTSLLGGVTHGISDWTGTIDLIPQNTTIRIFKDDQTYSELTNLKMRRMNVEMATSYNVCIYSEVGSNNNLMIANNTGYNREYFQGFSTLSDPSKIQPYIKYYNHYTNRIRFISGEYPKSAEVNPATGYEPLSIWGLTESVTGYVGYSTGGVDEAIVSITTGMTFVATSFITISQFFGYMIFPGISLGLLLCIPLILQLIFVIIRIIKKG